MFGNLMARHVELNAPETCPECGSQLARDAGGRGEHPCEPRKESKDGSPGGGSSGQPAIWHCPNPDFPPQVLKRVALWAAPEAVDIAGCDAALVAQLLQCGLVRDAAEFYRLKLAEIVLLEGVDETKSRLLWDAIKASKQREAWRVLFGLHIPNIGAAGARAFCEGVASLEDLFAMGRERLLRLEGVTEVMARSLTQWFGDPVNRKLLKRLEKGGVNLKTAL